MRSTGVEKLGVEIVDPELVEVAEDDVERAVRDDVRWQDSNGAQICRAVFRQHPAACNGAARDGSFSGVSAGILPGLERL